MIASTMIRAITGLSSNAMVAGPRRGRSVAQQKSAYRDRGRRETAVLAAHHGRDVLHDRRRGAEEGVQRAQREALAPHHRLDGTDGEVHAGSELEQRLHHARVDERIREPWI